ncbi:MAG: preprotein translocase subunit SecE [Prevotellaceae bacterium]|nr:preprotein translocase subunit SecE [Prevotellaceae bacterium]
MFKSIFNYCKVSYEELAHKVTWPSRSELMNSAVLVLVASLCIAVVIFVVDQVFQHGMELVYGLLR